MLPTIQDSPTHSCHSFCYSPTFFFFFRKKFTHTVWSVSPDSGCCTFQRSLAPPTPFLALLSLTRWCISDRARREGEGALLHVGGEGEGRAQEEGEALSVSGSCARWRPQNESSCFPLTPTGNCRFSVALAPSEEKPSRFPLIFFLFLFFLTSFLPPPPLLILLA